MKRWAAAILSVVALAGEPSGPVVHDLHGQAVNPLASSIVVLLFTRTDCPISDRYAPDAKGLYEKFKHAGVTFWLVYVDPNQAVNDVRTHVAEYGYAFGAVLDRQHELVRFSRATTTPEAVVYVRGRLVYRGRIDDRYLAPGRARAAPANRDLEQVLTDAVAGKPLTFRSTRATGCYIEDLR